MVDQRYRRFIANGAVWSDFVIVLEPSFHFSTCVVKAHEPVGVQTLGSELAIEAFPSQRLLTIACRARNERIVSRLVILPQSKGF